MTTQKILDFVLQPHETDPIIQGMKINQEVAIQSRIAELSYDPTLHFHDIAGMIRSEFGVTVSEGFVARSWLPRG